MVWCSELLLKAILFKKPQIHQNHLKLTHKYIRIQEGKYSLSA